MTLRRRDGSRFPAYVRCVPLGDELGRPMAMVGVATDLTYEKEKECVTREMARLKSFNENIVASINDGIQIIDRRGFITFVNHRMEELLEYREGRLVGSHYSAIVAPEDQFRLAEIIRDEERGQKRRHLRGLLDYRVRQKTPDPGLRLLPEARVRLPGG